MELPRDLITSTEARKLLGVSPIKMAKLLKHGVLKIYPDPLDERKKLVSREEVLALKVPRVEAA